MKYLVMCEGPNENDNTKLQLYKNRVKIPALTTEFYPISTTIFKNYSADEAVIGCPFQIPFSST